MEAAFVYGARHQFALTTEVALLRNVGYVDDCLVERGDGAWGKHSLKLSCLHVHRPMC